MGISIKPTVDDNSYRMNTYQTKDVISAIDLSIPRLGFEVVGGSANYECVCYSMYDCYLMYYPLNGFSGLHSHSEESMRESYIIFKGII